MKYIFFLFTLFISSCGNPEKIETDNSASQAADSVQPSSATLDTIKQLPPRDFITTCAGIYSRNLGLYIHNVHGFWYIKSDGAMPTMMRLRDMPMLTKQENLKFSKVKADELPKVDCNSKTFWTKTGCFAKEENTFMDEKIWTYCGLTKEEETSVESLAKTIKWTVINTREGRYYFSLIDGNWFLTFVDLRTPCSA